MAKTRKMRRGTRRMHRMRGRGMFNAMKQKLTPSNQTKEALRQATFAITPSQAKMNYLRNKTQKVGNYLGTMRNKGKAGYNSLKKGMSGFTPSMPKWTSGNAYQAGQTANAGFSLLKLLS